MWGARVQNAINAKFTRVFFCGKILFSLACTSWQSFTSQNEINCSQNHFQSLGSNTKRRKHHSLCGLSWKFDETDILSGFALKPFMYTWPYKMMSLTFDLFEEAIRSTDMFAWLTHSDDAPPTVSYMLRASGSIWSIFQVNLVSKHTCLPASNSVHKSSWTACKQRTESALQWKLQSIIL